MGLVYRVPDAGGLEFRRIEPTRDSYRGCDNRCVAIRAGKESLGFKVATQDVFLVGHPAGHVCQDCAKEMRQVWLGAHDSVDAGVGVAA